jgi:hypothetical protein
MSSSKQVVIIFVIIGGILIGLTIYNTMDKQIGEWLDCGRIALQYPFLVKVNPN